MSLLHRIPRAMLAATFVASTADVLRHPQPRAESAGWLLSALARRLPLSADPVTLVRANAAIQLGAGTLLTAGRLPRLSAGVLAASLIPTTIGGHAFWRVADPTTRAQQRAQFLKNTAMLGGLLLAAGRAPAPRPPASRARCRARG
ncbi:MAG: DoxX family membrane protein [Actinomycetes bacterium]